ncbi:hypothetical protein HPB48_017107 [Haemaphysalis longicornis]|uniref:Uncharacterized protein n=1 Tax=Haemaphysalis longicornis TaxID=44386 RepID=A0A9J6GW70_HAELO|nr:hypothetical protein HPB48_017107 [Haemaphysalis longicornis]
MGNSITKGTSPDLAIIGHIFHEDWAHLGEYLGSDHAILATTIHGTEYPVKFGTARLTDSTKLREGRRTREKMTNHPSLTLQEWISRLREDVQKHTKVIETSATAPCVDARLLHKWEARRSLKAQPKVKKRIALLTEEAARYATSLSKENWLALCDGMRNFLRTSKTWKLLRFLIDPGKSERIPTHNGQNTSSTLGKHTKPARHSYGRLPSHSPYASPSPIFWKSQPTPGR